ncbi:hypothetical protein WN51_06428 [Melipona quadrifasciata]|uniref:Uncharacterized protein n=1 Tax=Melipona quadrifasciata TaxID=166423 RepID=A0A0M9AAT3_9HYME|nr:hypothetical protein WN51_06428 [Melipona quadrifasciata]
MPLVSFPRKDEPSGNCSVVTRKHSRKKTSTDINRSWQAELAGQIYREPSYFYLDKRRSEYDFSLKCLIRIGLGLG